MRSFNLNTLEPYRILFPLGLIHAFVGVSLWILFPLNLLAYPAQSHPHHMVAGFLLSFAMGFMMTAIPKFTGTNRCSKTELISASSLSVCALFSNSPLIVLGMLITILIFFIKRLSTRLYSPPPHFIFLPIGFFFGILGSTLIVLVQNQIIPSSYLMSAKLFLYYGTMLSLLLGIGAKLISALLGWTTPPNHSSTATRSDKSENKSKWTIPCIQATIFFASFFIEVALNPFVGRGLRAACVTWIAIKNWRLYRLPKASGFLALWVWISAWTLLTGLWIHSLFPSTGVHAAHLIFIGGFALMTLLIASRVSLAHGGFSLKFESKPFFYTTAGILMILAAITRFIAPWTSSITLHFAYAAGLCLLVLIFWAYTFFPKILSIFSEKLNNK